MKRNAPGNRVLEGVLKMSIEKLYLELTDRCNLNCTICYRQSWKEIPSDMDSGLCEGLIAEIKTLPALKTVVLGGIGEPTCGGDFIKTLYALKDYELIVTTNGVGLSAEIVEAMVDCVNSVVVSIDGLDQVFKDIRGVALKDVTDSIEALNRLKKERGTSLPAVNLQCVLSKDNVDNALALVDLAGSLHIETLTFSNLLPQSVQNKDKILYTRYENSAMKTLFSQLTLRSFSKGVKLVLPNAELKTERFCSFIEENAVFVSSDGEVLPCYRLSHGYTEYVFGREKQILRHSFGNLRDQSLAAIWQQPNYQAYRQRILNNRYPSCIDCDLVDGCEYVNDSAYECWGGAPSCGDCLWSRRFVICP